MSKYHNHKITVDGKKFDSKKEAHRYCELKLLEKAGQISDLRHHVPYLLIPKQEDKDGNLLERECNYIADFEYLENGVKVVEDVKGVRTAVYKIKKKLMLLCYGIHIRET